MEFHSKFSCFTQGKAGVALELPSFLMTVRTVTYDGRSDGDLVAIFLARVAARADG
jgi:hypothetical protein